MSTTEKATKTTQQIGKVRTLPAGTKLERHPLSALFPDASEDQTENLRNSLRTHGQQNPIALMDGKVIDGWGRYSQLTGLNLPLLVADYIGDDPTGFVFAQNYCRRSMTKQQRLVTTAKLTNLKQGKPKEGAKQANLSLSLEQAAKLTGISETTIKNVKKVIESKNSELIKSVESEKISVDMGLKLLDKPKDQVEAVLNSENPKKTFNELFPKQPESKDNGSGSKKNKAEQQDKPSPEQEPEKGTPAAESAKESGAAPISSQTPAAPKQSRSNAPSPQAGSGGAAALFAYVQEEFQKLPYEEQEEFWDLMWKFLTETGCEQPKQDVQDAPEQDNSEDDFDDSDMLEGGEEAEQED